MLRRREGRLAGLSRAELARAAPALAPAAVYLGIRALGLAVLALFAQAHEARVLDELRSWDGLWLLGLAEYGYTGLPPGRFGDAAGHFSAETPYGFFPGYPLLVALLGRLSIPLTAAGLAISVVAGVVAAYGLVRLACRIPGGSRRAGLVLVGLFAAAPLAVVLSMVYTEALFCALAVWALVFVLEERWLAAGVLSAVAGLVRPTAIALVAALAVGAICAAAAARPGRGFSWAPLAGTAIGAAGVLGWQLAVWLLTGAPGGWSGIQARGWGWGFDGGVQTVAWMGRILLDGSSVFELVVVGVVVGSIVLLGIAVRARLPWPLLAYGGAIVVLTAGTYGLMFTKARFLLPAFVLLVPPAFALARRSTATAAALVGAAALGSAWIGGVALVVWTTAI